MSKTFHHAATELRFKKDVLDAKDRDTLIKLFGGKISRRVAFEGNDDAIIVVSFVRTPEEWEAVENAGRDEFIKAHGKALWNKHHPAGSGTILTADREKWERVATELAGRFLVQQRGYSCPQGVPWSGVGGSIMTDAEMEALA